MTTSIEIKERRERLGVTQAWIADRVRELSGNPTYSQQSYQKFESNPAGKSSYLVYILQALEEAERDQDREGLIRESVADYGTDTENSELAATMLKRIAHLTYSGRLSNTDLALISQLIERIAHEN